MTSVFKGPSLSAGNSRRAFQRIFVVSPVLPPKLDGIGDYTARLAAQLALKLPRTQITILTGRTPPPDLIEGVSIRPLFENSDPASYEALLHAVIADRPDWVILQYNPFGYGRRGLNLRLPRIVNQLRKASPETKVAIMFHEMYVPVNNWKFAVMSTWQRYQFYALAKAADVLLFSIDPWAEHHRKRMPGKPIYHLPVGSNIPMVPISRADARRRLGISDAEQVLGIFGTAHQSRLFHLVRQAAEAIQASGRSLRVLYIGPHADAVGKALPGIPLIAKGPLSSDEVSRRLATIDVFLATYVDGVSTRRGAMMAAFEHGLAVVGTSNYNTDQELKDLDGSAIKLIPTANSSDFGQMVLYLAINKEEREQLGISAATNFTKQYSWSSIADKLLVIIERHAT